MPAEIWPSRDYYLNIASAEEDWNQGEFCPVEIQSGNKMTQLDGLYGLSDDVAKAVGYNGEEGDPLEEQHEAGVDKYTEPIWKAVSNGATSGEVAGVAGLRRWRIVYAPDPYEPDAKKWTSSLVPVVAGQQYGEKPSGDE
jgi:hypothetical protein